MVFSPGSSAIACFRAMGRPAAPAVFSTTPTVMPLMRHSARPMPPPWSASCASDRNEVGGRMSWALCEVMADAGHAAAVEQLGEVELGDSLSDLAVGVAGKLLAHQVGAVEDLVELVDAEDLKASDDGQHVRALGRRVEEALWRYGEPFAGLRGEQDCKRRQSLSCRSLTADLSDRNDQQLASASLEYAYQPSSELPYRPNGHIYDPKDIKQIQHNYENYNHSNDHPNGLTQWNIVLNQIQTDSDDHEDDDYMNHFFTLCP